MGKTYDTRLLAHMVSELAGQPIEIVWCQSRDLPEGLIGLANWQMILLDERLARRSDPILPEVLLHEIGHILLHKRLRDKAFTISGDEKEREARHFAEEMSVWLPSNFIWDALTGDLSAERARRGRAEFERVAALKIFKRNCIREPYQRASQGDVEITYKGQPLRRTQTAQHRTRQGTQSAEALEAQARREHSLAAKVTDPKLRDIIRDSATGKTELAARLRGRPVDPARRMTEKPMEISQPYRTTLTLRK